MIRVLNKICIITLSCLLVVCANIKVSHAFGPFPPMPFDIVIDIPANAGKVVSILQETKRYADSVKRYKKALSIQAVVGKIKLFALEQADKFGIDPTKLVKDGLGGGDEGGSYEVSEVLQKNNKLSIEKGDTNEENLENAFYQLFLVYPAESEELKDDDNNNIKISVLRSAHKSKGIEYGQDVAMNTYLYAQKKEIFLDVIERTIDRLDACQKAMGADSGVAEPDDCTFFGLAMVKVPSQEEAPEASGGEEGAEGEDETPAGQSEEMQNAYVVSVVYDRLLRVIEELTAVEAELKAAQQIRLVTPADQGESQSDASDYINKSYKFAYSEQYEASHAKLINTDDFIPKIKFECKGRLCPKKLKGSFETKQQQEEIPDVGKLQAMEHILNKAIQVHNLKSQLPDYKMQYRQYLMAKKIHERTFNALQDSEKCIIEFIDEHNGDVASATRQWQGQANPFLGNYVVNHDQRGEDSISKALLKEYQRQADKKILGITEEQCKDYFVEGSICPSGYVLDVSETSTCKNEDGKEVVDAKGNKLYPCVVKTVTPDIPEDSLNTDFSEQGATAGDESSATYEAAGISDPNDESSFNENEFMADSDQSEQLENDTRKKNELTWRIGANKMLELAKNNVLNFKPWKDQEYLQREYLRNKYRNIRLIAKSMDQAKISYIIAKNENVNPIVFDEGLLSDLSEISQYVSLDETARKAKGEYCDNVNFYCNGTGSLAYRVEKNKENGSVKLHGYVYEVKYYTDENGNYIYDDEGKRKSYKVKKAATRGPIYSQVKGIQKYKNTAKSTDEFVQGFTNMPNDLKNKYFAEELAGGKINEDVVVLSEKFYTKAKDDLGRGVARDLLDGVFNTREEANKELQAFLNSYYGPNGSITKVEKEIEKQKKTQSEYVVKQDEKQKEKNSALDEEKRTKERIVDIDNQIAMKEEQKSNLEAEEKSATNKVVKALRSKAKKGVEQLIVNLKKEKDYLATSTTKCTKNTDANCPTEEYTPEKVIQKTYKTITYELEDIKTKVTVIKANISENKAKLEELTEDFSAEYIEKAQTIQAKIEYSNQEYEDFVEPKEDNDDNKVYRMLNNKTKVCDKWFLGKWTGICTAYSATPYEKDNIKETINQFYNDGNGMENHIKKYVEANIKDSDIGLALSGLGIADEFYLASELSGVGLKTGPQTAVISAITKAIKEAIVKHTVEQIASLIKDSDDVVQVEADTAVKKIEELAKKLGVCKVCEGSEATIDIYDATKYGYTVDKNGDRTLNEITKLHKDMLDDLSNSSLSGIVPDSVVKEIYGIPELVNEDEVAHKQGIHSLVDNEYFVGLPARGVINDDENSGRDYAAPKGPLGNTPPLREVFYYSPLDYDDVPKEGNGKKRPKKERFSPSIPHLLDFKYDTYATGDKWEYMPEIWNYILAIPSLRNDGKYQQTFVERSMDSTQLNSHIRGTEGVSANNNKYAHIMSRAGVYPCKIGNKIIDVMATMDIKEKKNNGDVLKGYDIKYIYTIDDGKNKYPKCKEVQLTGSKIKHLLADEDKNTTDISVNAAAKEAYNGASELGQFIDVNNQYRWFLQETYKFLTDKTQKKNKKDSTPPNQINNVWRQLHDLSAYKRNLFGSFLDTVSAEKDAKTNLENAKYQLEEVLKQLCDQVHELGVVVGDTAKNIEEIYNSCSQCEDCEETCSEEAIVARKSEVCVSYIMSKGLAKNVDDKIYGSTEYDGYNGIKQDSKQIYDELYFLLDEEKDKLLNEKQTLTLDNENSKEEVSYSYLEVMNEFKSKFQKNKKWDSRIEDRMTVIESMYNSLIKDAGEVMYLTPDDENEVNIQKATVNKIQSFKSGEEGLKGMDNQSKIVPYCPSY